MPQTDIRPLARQEGGNHYKGYKIQPVEFAMANNLNLCQANVVKYVVRYKDKGGIEDLRKAIHYLELLIEFEYEGKTSGPEEGNECTRPEAEAEGEETESYRKGSTYPKVRDAKSGCVCRRATRTVEES